jgi:hypothetical protein
MSEEFSHLSEIQALCTNLESDVELVLGSIYGLREWFVYSGRGPGYAPVTDFTLVGHYGQPWDPTVLNQAECRATPPIERMTVEIDARYHTHPDDVEREVRIHVDRWLDNPPGSIDYSTAKLYVSFTSGSGFLSGSQSADWLLDDPVHESRRLAVSQNFMTILEKNGAARVYVKITGQPSKHEVGHPRCTCGIYAYHDLNSLRVSDGGGTYGTVYGLVEGTGHVTVGTKGFRAEKAQVRALTLPQRCTLPSHYIRGQVDRWLASGIAVFPNLLDLFQFAQEGGFLSRPEDLQP